MQFDGHHATTTASNEAALIILEQTFESIVIVCPFDLRLHKREEVLLQHFNLVQAEDLLSLCVNVAQVGTVPSTYFEGWLRRLVDNAILVA